MSRQNEISDKKFANEQGLRDIYYHPKTGYRSAEKLYQKARGWVKSKSKTH